MANAPLSLTQADVQRLLGEHGAPDATVIALIKSWLIRVPADHFDYYVVYATPSEQWLGLETPKERRQLTVNVAHPSIRADEVSKFCALLKDGDTTVVEALYVDGIYESDAWKELKKSRRELACTKQVFNKYVGQPHRTLIEKDDTTPQRQANYLDVFRWLLEARRLLAGKEPRVLWSAAHGTDDDELAQLHKFVNGSRDEMRKQASELVSSLASKFTTPISSDMALIQGWLVRLRRGLLPPRKP